MLLLFCSLTVDSSLRMNPTVWTSRPVVLLMFFTAGMGLMSMPIVRRVKPTPDPDTSEKYHETSPISIAILWQKYALLLAESGMYTSNLYRDAFPSIAMLLQKY